MSRLRRSFHSSRFDCRVRTEKQPGHAEKLLRCSDLRGSTGFSETLSET
jgi:hypothetical protein